MVGGTGTTTSRGIRGNYLMDSLQLEIQRHRVVDVKAAAWADAGCNAAGTAAWPPSPPSISDKRVGTTDQIDYPPPELKQRS